MELNVHTHIYMDLCNTAQQSHDVPGDLLLGDAKEPVAGSCGNQYSVSFKI